MNHGTIVQQAERAQDAHVVYAHYTVKRVEGGSEEWLLGAKQTAAASEYCTAKRIYRMGTTSLGQPHRPNICTAHTTQLLLHETGHPHGGVRHRNVPYGRIARACAVRRG